MAKLTAVIDIGSNSARLVIFQKTSRYGFHLLCQYKSRVRIGESAYKKNGYLQPVPMERAYNTLKAFSRIISEYRAHKTICVATSALRDAPNRSQFISKVKQNLDINIKVIDGESEARYGSIAAGNLLPIENAITIDIGGGSSDIAKIIKGEIVETFSLDLGTVRLKELFTTDKIDIAKATKFINKELARLPGSFIGDTAVGIGGTARALAKGIMRRGKHPLDKLHAFTYSYKDSKNYFDQIILGSSDGLDVLHIKSQRHDTIREGTLILKAILGHIKAKRVVSSGVGVREGIYLHDRLRKQNDRFPVDINPSIQSIKDRFDILELPCGNKFEIADKLFELFIDHFDATKHDRKMVTSALNLSNIGKMLTIYKEHQHAFYIAMQELNFGFTHQEMITIAMLLRSKGKKYHKTLYTEYKELLPKKKRLKWLIFIYSLTLILHENSAKTEIALSFDKNTLFIDASTVPYLAIETLHQFHTPKNISIVILDKKK